MSSSLSKTEKLCADAIRAAPHMAEEPTPLINVRTYSGIEELPKSLLDLFETAGRHSAFLTLPWFQNFIANAMDPSEQLYIYGALGAGNAPSPSGMLLMRGPGKLGSFLALRKLSSLSNYYSPFFSTHQTPAVPNKREILQALVHSITLERPRWDAIELRPLDVNAESFGFLVDEFKSAGFVTQTYFCAGNWYEPVNGRSYREYFGSLRSSVRNIAISKNRKLERSGRVRCEIYSRTEELEKVIAAYNKVYAASWKVPEPYKEFVPGLIRTCAAQGTLRLGVAFVDDEPAAAQLWIVYAGTASIFKISYDQKFKNLSVGTYLTTRMMEHVIDIDRVDEVDYLTGDDNYKRDWMSQRRERWGILALNPRTPLGALAIARHVGGRTAKNAVLSLANRLRRGSLWKNKSLSANRLK